MGILGDGGFFSSPEGVGDAVAFGGGVVDDFNQRFAIEVFGQGNAREFAEGGVEVDGFNDGFGGFTDVGLVGYFDNEW